MKFATLVVSFFVVCLPCTYAQQPAYKDPKQPIAKRVTDLLSRMTLEEKVAQLQTMHRPAVFIIDYSGEQYCLLKNACEIKNDAPSEATPSSPLLCLHSNNPGPGFEDLWVPFQYIKYVFLVERVRRPNGSEFIPVPDK